MAKSDNPYQTQKATIKKIIPETSSIKTFRIRPRNPFNFQCGQFAELMVPNVGEGPFAPSSASYEPELLEFTIQNVGYMTSRLHEMSEGDIVRIRGPYGNGFPLRDFEGKDMLLVIGGVGFPPARTLLYNLLQEKDSYKSISMCYGARTPEDIVYKYQIDELQQKINLFLTVDQANGDWPHQTGVVTVLLDKMQLNIPNTIAVVIGPPVMMKFSTYKLLDLGLSPEQIILSMERKMYCGIGQCRHCMIDHLFICKDGPVFTYAQLKDYQDIWE